MRKSVRGKILLPLRQDLQVLQDCGTEETGKQRQANRTEEVGEALATGNQTCGHRTEDAGRNGRFAKIPIITP